MKILMVIPEVYFQTKGTPFSSYNRARVMSDLGYSVDILTYPFGEDKKIKGSRIIRCGKFPFINDIPSGPSIKKILQDFMMSLEMFNLLLHESYDLIYSHEEAAFFGNMIGKVFGKKTIYDMHSYVPLLFGEWELSKSKFFYKVGLFIQWLLFLFSDIIVVNCKNLGDLAKKHVPNKPRFVIENSAVMQRIGNRKTDKDRRMELGIKDEKVIMYIGSFVTLQNLDLLLKSAPTVIKKFPKVKYVMIGAKKGSEHTKYLSLAEDLGISKNVIIKRRVPAEDVPSYLACADIVVSPRKDGVNIPFKIYTLMESGAPILAVKSKLYDTFLDPSNSMLPEADEKSFSDATIKLLSDSKLRKQLSAAALKKSRKEYSTDVYNKKVKQLLEAIDHE